METHFLRRPALVFALFPRGKLYDASKIRYCRSSSSLLWYCISYTLINPRWLKKPPLTLFDLRIIVAYHFTELSTFFLIIHGNKTRTQAHGSCQSFNFSFLTLTRMSLGRSERARSQTKSAASIRTCIEAWQLGLFWMRNKVLFSYVYIAR